MAESTTTAVAGNPTVAIVMATFNSSRTIGRAITSVTAQSYQNWVLYVVDDASTDDTRQLVTRLSAAERRIHLITLTKNVGPAGARNAALSRANADWLAILDADDAWESGRLQTLLSFGVEHRADCVCDNLLAFDQHLEKKHKRLFARLPTVLTVQDLLSPCYQGTFDLGYLKPVLRLAFLRENDIIYDESLRANEDLVLLFLLLLRGANICCVDLALYTYTTAVGPVSNVRSRSSVTRADDLRLIRALKDIHDAHRQQLASQDRAAIANRISFLLLALETAEFDEARRERQWRTMLLMFLRQPKVRLKLFRMVKKKLLNLIAHPRQSQR